MALEGRLLGAFVDAHPAQAARALELMSASEAAEVMADLPSEMCAELLRWLSPVLAARAVESVPAEQAARALSSTRRDVAAAILRAMSRSHRSIIMESMSVKSQKATKGLLRYAEDTAGALMDPEVLTIAESISVADALERIRQSTRHALYYVYVVTEDQKLVGVVNVRDLVGARPDQVVGLVAARPVESVSTRASWQAVVAHPGWGRFHALPVVESDGRFAGVIRYESVRNLEERLSGTRREDHGAQTAMALGELYGLGLRGLVESATAAMLGSGEPERGTK
jgi:magnesium transporter